MLELKQRQCGVQVLEAKRSPTSSIPRIAHITWLLRPGASSSRKFQFYHFLSVLSALHVAGLRHVYVHGDVRPIGEWWEKLRGENVTFVHIEPISQVFQQSVRLPAHRSDILRAHILRTHGGVYMDGDVFWVNRLPDDLLAYPTVACPDWPSRGEWPAAFNIGVLMLQSDSPWLRHFLATMRRYMDSIWYFNGIMMPYRTYEPYPESLHIDYHLQSLKQRDQVFHHARVLKDSQSSVYVREDFSVTVRQKRSGLVPLMKQMRSDGLRATLHNDKLVTDRGTYIFDLEKQQYQKLERRPTQPQQRRGWQTDRNAGHRQADQRQTDSQPQQRSQGPRQTTASRYKENYPPANTLTQTETQHNTRNSHNRIWHTHHSSVTGNKQAHNPTASNSKGPQHSDGRPTRVQTARGLWPRQRSGVTSHDNNPHFKP
ncbi:hypothetical protein ACOMHN_067284 [Nucella lapillus]